MFAYRKNSAPACRRLSIVSLACLALLIAVSGVPAQDEISLGPLKLRQPWTRATAPGAPGSAYLTITNTGSGPDRLVAISSPLAVSANVHEMKMDGGVMVMRPLTGGLKISAGETVTLKPGGLHIMLMKLAGPIATGEAFPLTLTFEHAGTVTLDFVAAPLGAREPPAAGGG